MPDAAVAITTTFADNQGILEFRNSSLPGGQATFCEDDMEKFTQETQPPSSSPTEIASDGGGASAESTLSSFMAESQTTSTASNGFTQDVFPPSFSSFSVASSEIAASSLDQQPGISTSFAVSLTTIAPGESRSGTIIAEISSTKPPAFGGTSQTPLSLSQISQPLEESPVAPPLVSSTGLLAALASSVSTKIDTSSQSLSSVVSMSFTASSGSFSGFTNTQFPGIESSDMVPGVSTATNPIGQESSSTALTSDVQSTQQPQTTDLLESTGFLEPTSPTAPMTSSTGLESQSSGSNSGGLEQGSETSSLPAGAPTENSSVTTSATEPISSSMEAYNTTSSSFRNSTNISSLSEQLSTSSSVEGPSSSASESMSEATSSGDTTNSASETSSTATSSSSSSTSAAATPVCVSGLDYSAAVYDLDEPHPVCGELFRNWQVKDAFDLNLGLVIENRVPQHTGLTPQGDGTRPILEAIWLDAANWEKPYSIYDYTAPSTSTSSHTCLVVMHRGYIKFPTAGSYKFNIITPESTNGEVDDNLYIWLGDLTISENFWPRNSLISKLFETETHAQKVYFFSTTTADELVPIRAFYANRLGPGKFKVEITGPSTPSLLSCTGGELPDWLPWEDERVFVDNI
ncbi:hypothetical protein DHEL01_v207086 [Diaporthe helianthi]|uniref:PA14 domain-containing protein n=1 Tax=Diaporthe helianthi TaxID=158607 RepID=A0A2P5HW80_DIAHE|nr:hypothetical protein DHEL01_v207086 [Diaporthe helianthi]